MIWEKRLRGISLIELIIVLGILLSCIPVLVKLSNQFSRDIFKLRNHFYKEMERQYLHARLDLDFYQFKSIESISTDSLSIRFKDGKIAHYRLKKKGLRRQKGGNYLYLTKSLKMDRFLVRLDHHLLCLEGFLKTNASQERVFQHCESLK